MLVVGLARKFSSSPAVSAAALLLFVFNPAIILAESRGGPEVFQAFAVSLFLWLLYRALARDRIRDHLLAGLALGLVTLVKPTTLFFPLAWAAYLLVAESRKRRRQLVRALVLGCGVAALMAPWVIRNYAVSGSFVPTMTIAGMSANQGLHITRRADLLRPWAPGNATGGGMNGGAYEMVDLAREQGIPFKGNYFINFYSSRDEVVFNNYLVTT